MILNVEPYFQTLCGQLNWRYLGLKADFDQEMERIRDEEALPEEQELALLAVQEDSSVVFRLADGQGVPAKVENFEALSGGSRYYLGTLLLVASSSIGSTALQDLSKYLASNWHENTRIGISHCFIKTTSNKVYHKIDFFFPLNNSFGG